MITTCDRCKWGKREVAPPGDKYEGEVFYYCEATRYLIPEGAALEVRETCANFLPTGASCDNCDKRDDCPNRGKYKAGVCIEWRF